MLWTETKAKPGVGILKYVGDNRKEASLDQIGTLPTRIAYCIIAPRKKDSLYRLQVQRYAAMPRGYTGYS